MYISIRESNLIKETKYMIIAVLNQVLSSLVFFVTENLENRIAHSENPAVLAILHGFPRTMNSTEILFKYEFFGLGC